MSVASLLLMIAKITTLFLVTAAALWTMRRASASSRHLLITLVFCATLLLPLLAFALPGWTVVVFEEQVVSANQAEQPGEARLDLSTGGAELRLIEGSTVATESKPPARAGLVEFLSGLQPKQTAAMIWALVAVFLLGLLALRSYSLHRKIRKAQPIRDSSWTGLLKELTQRLQFQGSVELLRGGRGQMPLVWGTRRPVILLPQECDSWAAPRRRAVLAHELAHIARRDVAVIVLGQLVCALHWFHPLAWWLERRLAAERERACDDAAVAHGVPAAQYAEQLLQVAQTYGRKRTLAPVMAARSELEGRIMAILDTDRNRHNTSWKIRACLLALLGAALIPLSAATWAVQDKEENFDFQFVTDSDSASFRQHLIELDMLEADTDTLIRGLRSADALTRGACAWALGEKGDPRAVEPLIDVLGDVDPTVREWSLRALGDIQDPEAVEPVIDRLDDQDANVREWAARALGDLEDERAVEPLIDALDDQDSQVREWAARSLGGFRDERALQPLTDSLDDPDPQVQEWAARSLGDYGDTDDLPDWKQGGQREPLMPGAHRQNRQVGDPETIEALIRSLSNDESDVREWATRSLGNLDDGRSVPHLVDLLQDESDDVREWAARSLGAIGDPRAVNPLIHSLEDDNSQVREWSARSLGALRDERMIDPLIDRLRDDNDQVREWAVRALGAYGTPRALEPLAGMLDDENSQVRRWAKRALEHTGAY
jgi:HEAT repeat protein/beta-lactamase regulating signal transducer with metallopeptidase domain